MTSKTRTRKTSSEDRSTIIALIATGELTQKQIGALFNISQARVSQLKADALSLGLI